MYKDTTGQNPDLLRPALIKRIREMEVRIKIVVHAIAMTLPGGVKGGFTRIGYQSVRPLLVKNLPDRAIPI